MNTQLEQTLYQVFEALQFQANGAFTFGGYPSTTWGHSMKPATPNPLTATPNTTVQALQNALYATCYTREFQGVVDQSPAVTATVDPTWVSAISAANTSRERWEEGWQIQQFLPSGEVYAKKGAIERAFWPGEFVRSGDYGIPPGQGTAITVFLPREARNAQPGFYFVFGETPGTADDELPTVRFYWNVNREGAAPLTRKLSSTLNQYQVPFRFKIVSHPTFLDRSDTAVLYVGRKHYRITSELALETRAHVAAGMDQPVPLFTLRLAAGLSFAEDPGNQESFGMSRCRLLAEALWLAFNEGCSGTADRLTRINQHFAAAGTSLERPYLNVATLQTYEFPQ